MTVGESSSGRAIEAGQSVVVPAVSVPSTVACLRSLGKRGVRTIVVSERKRPAAFRSRYCDEMVRVPSPADDIPGYRDALLSLASRSDVRTIVPVREQDVYVLSKYADDFREHIHVTWPNFDTLMRVQDRVELFDIAAKAGVPTPKTGVLGDDVNWDRHWIVKSRYSVLTEDHCDDATPGVSVDPPSTKYLFEGVDPDVETHRDEMGHAPLLQEYVSTPHEYGFFALYDHGDPVATFQHRQVRGFHYAGGPSAYRESVDIPALESAGRSLLDALDWHGLAMVEFLWDETSNEFKLMEINPRFWSSLPFTVQAGADLPYYYWLLANGRAGEINADYQVGIGGHILRGEIGHVLSILGDNVALVEKPSLGRTAAEILRSLWRDPRFDYLSLEDPAPFVSDMIDAFVPALGKE